jgi:hypothetical protein
VALIFSISPTEPATLPSPISHERRNGRIMYPRAVKMLGLPTVAPFL